MFTQYQEQIEQLRATDKNFSRLCEKHSALDAEVEALVQRKSPSLQVQIENLKKQKLAVKEEIYHMLQQAQPILALKQQKNYMDQAKLAEMSGVRLSA
ncbi:YdcH family protein [Comamonas jiangduensis]